MPDPDTLEKDNENVLKKIIPITKKMPKYSSQWTDKQLTDSIAEFFDYCASVDLKPTQPLLRIWLNVSRDTMWDWRTKPERYGSKCDIIKGALDILEAVLQSNIDKYPTGSIFLLKTSHGHKESVDVNVTSQNASKEDIGNAIANLGLDKPEE